MRHLVAAIALSAATTFLSAQSRPTYTHDVQPILAKHCQSCHRRGEVAPMPLISYADTKQHAAKIKELVAGKKMPPVIGTPHYTVLTRGEGLTPAEINTLVKWADAGAPEGPAPGASRRK